MSHLRCPNPITGDRPTSVLDGDHRVLRSDGPPPLVAESAAMDHVRGVLERLRQSHANVLVTGERGTGKEGLARLLHATSQRSGRTLVAVSASVLADAGLETELFGQANGGADLAGCLELGRGATVYLEGITGTSLDQQRKLLEFLRSGALNGRASGHAGPPDVRIISSTHVDIVDEVDSGRFDQDLLDVLGEIEVRLPPLRKRAADIPLLARHFLQVHGARYGKSLHGFDAQAMIVLEEHEWPGNVRELEQVVERAVLLSAGVEVTVEDLLLGPGTAALEGMTLQDVERVLIKKALTRHDGNVSRAARTLGLSRSALYRRLHRHGL